MSGARLAMISLLLLMPSLTALAAEEGVAKSNARFFFTRNRLTKASDRVAEASVNRRFSI